MPVRAHPGHLGGLRSLNVFRSKSVFNGVFVWASWALYSKKRRFPARAGAHTMGAQLGNGTVPIALAGLDEGLLSLSLSDLLYMENPYSYKDFSGE